MHLWCKKELEELGKDNAITGLHQLGYTSSREIRLMFEEHAAEMRMSGYSGKGYTLQEVLDAGVSLSQIRLSGYKVSEMREMGFGAVELRARGIRRIASRLRLASPSRIACNGLHRVGAIGRGLPSEGGGCSIAAEGEEGRPQEGEEQEEIGVVSVKRVGSIFLRKLNSESTIISPTSSTVR